MVYSLGVIARFGLYLDLAILFGVPLFGLYSPQVPKHLPRPTSALGGVYVAGVVLGLLLSALSIAALTASMAGVPLDRLDWSMVKMLVSQTSVGWATQVRAVALLLLGAVALMADLRRQFTGLVLCVLGAVALGSLAWAGHGAMDEGTVGTIHLTADIVHLLAAGAWIAAVLAFATLLARAMRAPSTAEITQLHLALDRFALVGSFAVALLIVTGFINGWLLVGVDGLTAIGTSLYLKLLALKLALFFGMLGLAALNRLVITPAIGHAILAGDHSNALARLRRSLAIEASLGIAILVLVAWLGTLMPPAAG